MALPEWVSGAARVALQNERLCWSRADLEHHVDALVDLLHASQRIGAPIGLAADNSPHWIAADLAAQVAGATLVPLPAFFTRDQLNHVIDVSGIESMLAADGSVPAALGFSRQGGPDEALGLFARPRAARARAATPNGETVQKITFTSGTTGTPKGVRLLIAEQIRTARGLAIALEPLGIESHLSLLPFSILLENVAGVYAPLLLGARCVCPALDEVGLSGACRFDADRCLTAIERYQPHSIILLPQMLSALVERLAAARGTDRRIRSLKLAAVGGAKTPPALIARARALGLPAYEGYGLSECASVVSLNHPGADRIGSVGRALSGVTVRVAADGEIEVAGRSFAGYLGTDQPASSAWLPTGDLGTVDAAGYLSIVGRKKDVLVTGFGRNVAAQWPEARLLEHASIGQAAVFGDARPYLVAVLVASSADVSDAMIASAVAAANSDLPDYAQIKGWLRAPHAFTADNGLATANGRVRRDAILGHYAHALDRLYTASARQA